MTTTQEERHSDKRRTRRNVIAMAVLLGSAVTGGMTGLPKSANASDNHRHNRNNNGNRQNRNDSGNHSHNRNDSGGNRSCFLSGSNIRTQEGEIAIENLRVGDLVLTTSGEAQAIKRIEHWQEERDPGKEWTQDVAPIKVTASALGPNIPRRDLYLSPLHCLYIDGVLIRVGALVNGRSIVRCSNYEADRLDYFHIELDDHRVIFAEGAPVSSCLPAKW